jgi:hypothetical protein
MTPNRWSHTRRRAALSLVLVVATVVGVTACSDDDDTVQTLSPGPSTSASPGTPPSTPATASASTTTESTTVPTTLVPTTTPPPPTTAEPDPEAIKQEVAAAYEKTSQQIVEMLRNPRLKNLERRLAVPLVKDSPSYREIEATVRDLVEEGERLALPERGGIFEITVEKVSLVGEPPHREALVTTCAVINQERVKSSDGSLVPPPAGLRAFREEQTMRLTDDGWKRYEDADQALGVWNGSRRCDPPAG